MAPTSENGPPPAGGRHAAAAAASRRHNNNNNNMPSLLSPQEKRDAARRLLQNQASLRAVHLELRDVNNHQKPAAAVAAAAASASIPVKTKTKKKRKRTFEPQQQQDNRIIPKRPAAPFLLFCADRRASITQQQTAAAGMQETNTWLGQAWREASEQTRHQYTQLHRTRMAAYLQRLQELGLTEADVKANNKKKKKKQAKTKQPQSNKKAKHKPSKAAASNKGPPFPRPVGRGKKGCQWDETKGVWVPVSASKTTPKSTSSSSSSSFPTIPRKASFQSSSGQKQQRSASKTPLTQTPKTPAVQKDDGTYQRPLGRAPNNMRWDDTAGLWVANNNTASNDQSSVAFASSSTTNSTLQQQEPPKKPPIAFYIYVHDQEATFRQRFPNTTHPDRLKLMGRAWAKMSVAQKAPYTQQHAAAMDAYLQAKAQHEQEQQQASTVASSAATKHRRTLPGTSTVAATTATSKQQRRLVQQAKGPLDQNDDGTYRRPSGRAPSNMVWNAKRGVWMMEQQGSNNNNKSGSNQQTSAARRRRRRTTNSNSTSSTRIVRPEHAPKRDSSGAYKPPAGCPAPDNSFWDSVKGVWVVYPKAAGLATNSNHDDSDDGGGLYDDDDDDMDDDDKLLVRSGSNSSTKRNKNKQRDDDSSSSSSSSSSQQQLVQDENGLYKRPRGGSPKGFEWDYHQGKWVAAAKKEKDATVDNDDMDKEEDAADENATAQERVEKRPASAARKVSRVDSTTCYVACGKCTNCRVTNDCGQCLSCRNQQVEFCVKRICVQPVLSRPAENNKNTDKKSNSEATARGRAAAALTTAPKNTNATTMTPIVGDDDDNDSAVQSLSEASDVDQNDDDDSSDDDMSDLEDSGKSALTSAADFARMVRSRERTMHQYDDDDDSSSSDDDDDDDGSNRQQSSGSFGVYSEDV